MFARKLVGFVRQQAWRVDYAPAEVARAAGVAGLSAEQVAAAGSPAFGSTP